LLLFGLTGRALECVPQLVTRVDGGEQMAISDLPAPDLETERWLVVLLGWGERARVFPWIVVVGRLSAWRSAAPPGLRFAPPRTDLAAQRNAYPIRDEGSVIRPGFYLRRRYFGHRLALNSTRVDPAGPAGAIDANLIQTNCDGAAASRTLEVRK
jgi:hypothetical protein